MVKSLLYSTIFMELLTTAPLLPHILSHINSFYNFISYFCLMSITFFSHLRLCVPSCLFPTSFFFGRKICKHLSLLIHVCIYVSSISFFFVEHFNNILRTAKIPKLLIVLFSPFSYHFQHLRSR